MRGTGAPTNAPNFCVNISKILHDSQNKIPSAA